MTKSEIQTLLKRIPQLESKVALSQSVLVLRLCGKVLERDLANKEDRTEFVNQVWTALEEEYGLQLNVAHYNALLSVYLENDHVFCPEYMQNLSLIHI